MKSMLENENLMDNFTGNKGGKYLLIGLPNDRLLQSVLHRQTLNTQEADAVYIGALRGNGIYYTDLSAYLDTAQEALKKAVDTWAPSKSESLRA